MEEVALTHLATDHNLDLAKLMPGGNLMPSSILARRDTRKKTPKNHRKNAHAVRSKAYLQADQWSRELARARRRNARRGQVKQV